MIKSFHLKRQMPAKKVCNPASKERGFSLVEMLMALLVASLLMAALAPVMTKKMNETVNFEGQIANPYKKRVVYLTETGDGEWVLPNGIRTFNITTVGAGGGGGAGSNYGCVVFTTEAGTFIGEDGKYCEIRRSNGSMNFTLPDGVNEIYVSLVSGGGGGAAGSANWADEISWDKAGTYNWSVPDSVRGDRVLVTMNGGGGGGGGADQGGGGGGASGGYVAPTIYNVASNKTTIPVIVGAGGKGGYYWTTPGKGGAGYKNGEDGYAGRGGGGGGGSSSFDGNTITAYGGGGGAAQPDTNAGWMYADLGKAGLWKTIFNYGGNGRKGGTSGPYTLNGTTYGGIYGGDGGAGGGTATGGNGANGTVGADGTAFGDKRGGQGGLKDSPGTGKGGYGQDYATRGNANYDSPAVAGGGAGGGGGASYFANGTSAPTGCKGPTNINITSVTIPKAGTGAGGAGANCAFNMHGTKQGGDGGDGIVKVNYLTHFYGGSGGRAGVVIPRSKIAYTNTMKAGSTITINIGKGGKGGDRIIAAPSGNNKIIKTVNSSGVENTAIANANGTYGTPSTIKFESATIATTGIGGCGGGYATKAGIIYNCPAEATSLGGAGGTRNLNGTQAGRWPIGWHGHSSNAICKGVAAEYDQAGSSTQGGRSTVLEWDGLYNSEGICGVEGGSLGIASEFSKRNGKDGGAGQGGSGGYYGGFGGKGGDGYVKIEWGIPRNIDRTAAERYSGGGGSAGESSTRKITVSPVVNKIKYRIGEGGDGGSFNSATNTMDDGKDGGDTLFGINGNYGFDTVKAKGGKGGKSAKITSTYDSSLMVTALTGSYGLGGIAQCYIASNCKESMDGSTGENNKGGKGGNSSTGTGADGANGNNIDGAAGASFNGTSGGGTGGGGGISASGKYGKGGKGGSGYIKIEYSE